MLAQNKNFRETYSEDVEVQDEFNDEKSFKCLGFKVKEFSKTHGKIKYPSCITCISSLIKNFKFCDTVIEIGKERFTCHFIIMKKYSKFFEHFGDFATRVELPADQVTPRAFCDIYEWILSNENHIKRQSFAEVFKAAKYLEIENLLQQLMIIIDDQHLISEREAVSIYFEAKLVGAKFLQSFMIGKISKIFLTFVASKDFLELSIEEVLEFFKSNRIAINSEMDMVFVAIRWSTYKWPRRMNYIKTIMSEIKFELILKWQLVVLKKYPQQFGEIFHLKEIQKALDEALSYQITSEIDQEIFEHRNCQTVPRRLIDDPLWKKYKFEENSNVHMAYSNFLKYLKELNACHWTHVKEKNDNKILNS